MQKKLEHPDAPPLVKITWHSMLSCYYDTAFNSDACDKSILTGLSLSDQTGIYIWNAWYHLLENNIKGVRENVLIACRLSRRAGNVIIDIMTHIGYTKYLIHTGETRKALDLVERRGIFPLLRPRPAIRHQSGLCQTDHCTPSASPPC